MVDKTTKAKVIIKPKSKKTESKEQAFNRLAKIRTEKVLKALRILGNCGNRTNYNYNEKQVEQIFNAIYSGVKVCHNKFVQSKKEIETFDFL